MSYARSKNLTTYDVVTIASMVEDEAQLASERPLVAAVIYNRLREGMPLGIDATVRFATGNYTEPLTESELAIESPYNTRLNAGLPPGPIGSPGLASIEAAAHPAKVDYLFYVVEAGQPAASTPSPPTKPSSKRDVDKLQLGPRSGRRQLTGQLRGIGVPRLAVLGHPVGHSRSPAMQSAALAELGLGGEWSYEAIDVAPDAFEARVRAMPGEGFAGANVTVPHKGAALALADELSETAREIGAANTLVFADGEIRAENTDADGLLDALPASPAGKRALVLGAGGAARAVVWALLREGAEVAVWNRTELRSRNLCEELGGDPVAEPDQSTLRPDRQLDGGRPGRRGSFRGAAAGPGSVRARADRRRHGLRPEANRAAASCRRCRFRRCRRPRGSRPTGRPLAGDLDRPQAPPRHHARRRSLDPPIALTA